MSYCSDVFLFGAEQETTMAFHDPTFSHGRSYDPYTQDDTYCQLSQLAINSMQDSTSEAQMDSTAWGWWPEHSDPTYQLALQPNHLLASNQGQDFPSQAFKDDQELNNTDSELERRIDKFQVEVEHRISQVEDQISQIENRVSQVRKTAGDFQDR
jgi:hypothetical protein